MSNFSARVEAWRQYVRAGANADFVLACIQIESDGEFPHRSKKSEPLNAPKWDERGPTEVSWPEASEILHMSAEDFARMMVDKQYALDKGIDLLDYYRDKWLPARLSWSNPLDMLRATKATHAGGMGFMRDLINATTVFYGRQPGNWQEMKTAFATIVNNGGKYNDASGATRSLNSTLTDLGPRVMKQIDKLDRLMGTQEGATFEASASGPSIASRLDSIPRPAKIAGGVLAVLAAIAVMRRSKS